MWRRALRAEDLWEGDLAPVELRGQHATYKVMLVRLAGGEIRAYQGTCPHQGAALDAGSFDGRYLSCSAHAWTFDLASGRGVNPAKCQLACFKVSVRAEQVFVRLGRERVPRQEDSDDIDEPTDE